MKIILKVYSIFKSFLFYGGWMMCGLNKSCGSCHLCGIILNHKDDIDTILGDAFNYIETTDETITINLPKDYESII